MIEISRLAHAKINLFLRVRGLREDGYHEIESLVLPVSLHDRVVVKPGEELSVSVGGESAVDLGRRATRTWCSWRRGRWPMPPG